MTFSSVFTHRNGREWWRLRSEFQKGLSSPANIREFLNDSDAITKEFVSQIQSSICDDFLPELSRLNLECNDLSFTPQKIRKFTLKYRNQFQFSSFCNFDAVVSYLAFDVRMESFTDKERDATSRSSRLMKAAEDTGTCLLPLDQGLPIWQYIETPVYRKFRLAQEYIERYVAV